MSEEFFPVPPFNEIKIGDKVAFNLYGMVHVSPIFKIFKEEQQLLVKWGFNGVLLKWHSARYSEITSYFPKDFENE